MPITLDQLKNSIKFEARITGTDEIDLWIIDLINQIIFDYTQSNRYQELLVLIADIPVVTNVGTYQLPEDFQHLDSVSYSVSQYNNFYQLQTPTDFLKVSGQQGRPWFYQLAGNSLSVFPFSLLVANQDRIIINYYKSHPELIDGDDLLLIPKLKNVIIQQAVSRTHVYYKEFQAAQILMGGAMKSNVAAQNSSEIKHG